MDPEWEANLGCYYFCDPLRVKKERFKKFLNSMMEEVYAHQKPEDFLLPRERWVLEESERITRKVQEKEEKLALIFSESTGRKIRSTDLTSIKTNKNHWQTRQNEKSKLKTSIPCLI